jgi:nicotinamidase-related amidase
MSTTRRSLRSSVRNDSRGGRRGDVHHADRPRVAHRGTPVGVAEPIMRSALIVIDMLNPYEHPDADPLMSSVRAALPGMRALIDAASAREAVTIYVNDHHGDWSATAAKLTERALAGRAPELVEPIAPTDDTPFVMKARHSIFYGTQVDYFLHEQEIDQLVLAGQVTEQCILYSALDAYVRHFEVAIAPDAVAHIHEDLAHAALRMMETNMRARLVPADEQAFASMASSDRWTPGRSHSG